MVAGNASTKMRPTRITHSCSTAVTCVRFVIQADRTCREPLPRQANALPNKATQWRDEKHNVPTSAFHLPRPSSTARTTCISGGSSPVATCRQPRPHSMSPLARLQHRRTSCSHRSKAPSTRSHRCTRRHDAASLVGPLLATEPRRCPTCITRRPNSLSFCNHPLTSPPPPPLSLTRAFPSGGVLRPSTAAKENAKGACHKASGASRRIVFPQGGRSWSRETHQPK